MTARPRAFGPARTAALGALDDILGPMPSVQPVPDAGPVPALRPVPVRPVRRVPPPRYRVAAEASIRRALAGCPSQAARLWISLAWSGLHPAEIGLVQVGHIRLGSVPPALLVPPGMLIELEPLTAEVLAAADLPEAGLIAAHPTGRPCTRHEVVKLAGSWLRAAGVRATVYEIARARAAVGERSIIGS